MLQPDENGVWPEGFVKDARWRAAMFVGRQTTSKKTGEVITVQSEFHERFKHLPIVQRSIAQGWGNELRGHLRLIVTRKILNGEPYHDVHKLLPDDKWIAERTQTAKGYWEARRWRSRIIEEYGSMEAFLKEKKPSNDAKRMKVDESYYEDVA